MDNKKFKKSIVYEKAFNFSIDIISVYKSLLIKKEYILSKQILKSGTSIGANIAEAINSLSKRDFSAKISIAYKEAHETIYWIRLLHRTKYLDRKIYYELIKKGSEICRILYAILNTTRLNK